MQNIVVALIVMACFVYVVQALMPAALRRALARWLARWPHWPAPLARRLQSAAREPMAGCGCDSCDRPAQVAQGAKATSVANAATGTPVAGQAQPIHILRRRP